MSATPDWYSPIRYAVTLRGLSVWSVNSASRKIAGTGDRRACDCGRGCTARVRSWQILLQKSFTPVIKNFSGFRRDFRAKMWGTSSPNDKLADDLGKAIEGTRISGRRSDFLTAGKLAPGNLGLLQQYLPQPVVRRCSKEPRDVGASAGFSPLVVATPVFTRPSLGHRARSSRRSFRLWPPFQGEAAPV